MGAHRDDAGGLGRVTVWPLPPRRRLPALARVLVGHTRGRVRPNDTSTGTARHVTSGFRHHVGRVDVCARTRTHTPTRVSHAQRPTEPAPETADRVRRGAAKGGEAPRLRESRAEEEPGRRRRRRERERGRDGVPMETSAGQVRETSHAGGSYSSVAASGAHTCQREDDCCAPASRRTGVRHTPAEVARRGGGFLPEIRNEQGGPAGHGGRVFLAGARRHA